MDPAKEKPKKLVYSAKDINTAIARVQSGELKPSAAAKAFNIPSSTLYDKLSGNHGGKKGTHTVLSQEEEQALVDWIKYCASVAQPLSRENVLKGAMKLSKFHGQHDKQFSDSGT